MRATTTWDDSHPAALELALMVAIMGKPTGAYFRDRFFVLRWWKVSVAVEITTHEWHFAATSPAVWNSPRYSFAEIIAKLTAIRDGRCTK